MSIRVLFISSGNSKTGISPIVQNQGNSLIKAGIDLHFYTIKGKGFAGYLSNIIPLRKHLKENKYDIVHAHYSLTSFVASLAGASPLVVSLMGSDVKAMKFYQRIIKLFRLLFWKTTIVKTLDMKKSLGISDIKIIPNGVDFETFKPLSKEDSQKELKWDSTKKHILFAANPSRLEKNYSLAKEAYDNLDDDNIVLHSLIDVDNNKMSIWYNASDVVLLTSNYEGSPNVIKEAMACNIPIVATDVGDIREVISKTTGCYVADSNVENITIKIQEALTYGIRTNGRNDMSHLNAKIIAERLINIYKNILSPS